MATLRRIVSDIAYLPEWVRCRFLRVFRSIRGQPPSLDCWLADNPNVAASIKWQSVYGGTAYDIPDSAKRPWPSWSDAEKQELVIAFEAAWNWLYKQPSPFTSLNEPRAYPPLCAA